MNSLSGSMDTLGVRRSALFIAVLLIIVVLVLITLFTKNDDGDFASLLQTRKELLQDKETLRVNWLRTLNPYIRDTEGDLVWNSEKQSGVMRFIDLPQQKESEQYHLWVYDLYQPQAKPISAGIFTVDTKIDGDFYVAITVEQEITLPYKFLLTLENKGDKTFSKSQSLLLAQP